MTLELFVRKLVRAAPTMAAIVSVTIATGCGAGCSASISTHSDKTGGTYNKHGVSFEIPDGWRQMRLTKQTQSGNEIWSESFGPKSGLDLVGVTAYATKVAITQKNAAEHAPYAAASIKDILTSAGGTLLEGPTLTAIGDMAGYRFETAFPEENGATLESRLLMVWNGHTEYFFNCQSRAHGSRSAEIERGCDTIIKSFRVNAG